MKKSYVVKFVIISVIINLLSIVLHELGPATIYDLRRADEIKINPGLVTENNWYRAGYKGGSEAGVLQYTHVLQKEKGADIYTLSVTVNNSKQKLNTDEITNLTSRLISLIKKENI